LKKREEGGNFQWVEKETERGEGKKFESTEHCNSGSKSVARIHASRKLHYHKGLGEIRAMRRKRMREDVIYQIKIFCFRGQVVN